MKVLHAYNRHRGGGGSDNAWDATIALSRERGLDVGLFERDSRRLTPGFRGKLHAACAGLYASGAIAAFKRTLSLFKPDLVHAHELYPLITPWILPHCRSAGIPVVFTCYDFRLSCPVATHYNAGRVCLACRHHGPHWAVLKNCRGSYLESTAYALRSAFARRWRLFTDHVSQFIVLTPFSKRWLVDDLGVDEHRVQINGCRIPLPAHPVDPAQGRYVGFAGRPTPEKGLEVLLAAAQRTGLPVKLAIPAGAAPIVTGPGVSCVRTRSAGELADFYRGARMLVVPSLWFETFGIVAAEAMSHGVPVLASRIGALVDTVQDGVSGLSFETGDADDLAEKMYRLWSDDTLCRALGSAARRQVGDNCNDDVHFARLVSTYERALESSA